MNGSLPLMNDSLPLMNGSLGVMNRPLLLISHLFLKIIGTNLERIRLLLLEKRTNRFWRLFLFIHCLFLSIPLDKIHN
jgi:hypothetical protein